MLDLTNGFLLNFHRKISCRSLFRSSTLLHGKSIDSENNHVDSSSSSSLRASWGTGRSLNQKIINIFDNIQDDKLVGKDVGYLRNFIEENSSLFTYVHCLTLLHRSARFGFDITRVYSLKSALQAMHNMGNRKQMTPDEIAIALWSVRTLKDTTKDIMPFLDFISNQLTNFVQTTTTSVDATTNSDSSKITEELQFRAPQISMSLNGLQKFSSSSRTIRKLVRNIAPLIKNLEDPMNEVEIGTALYGMRNMRSCGETEDILESLATQISNSDAKLNSVAIGPCLNGLRNFDISRSRGAKAVAITILPKIQGMDTNELISSQTMGAALFGLRTSHANERVVRSLLTALTAKADLNSPLNDASLSSSLFGLGKMCDDKPEVKNILKMIGDKAEQYAQKNSDRNLDPNIVCNALQGLGRMSRGSIEVKNILKVINSRIDVTDFKGYQSQIGMCMYGLRSIPNCVESRELIATFTTLLFDMNDALSEKDLSFIIYSLRNKGSSEEVKKLLAAVAINLNKSDELFKPQSTSMVALGLSKQSSRHEEVQAVLKALRTRLGDFDSQACGNVLYGMQSMRSVDPEVLPFLTEVTSRIEKCTQEMNAQEICNSILGLQGQNSCYVEVQKVVDVLSHKMASCRDDDNKFTAAGLAGAMFGLQTMGMEVQVLTLLGMISDKMLQCNTPFRPTDIGYAMFGLQGMSTDSQEVRTMLALIVQKMNECPPDVKFDARDIGYSLCGMHNKPLEVSEVNQAVSALQMKIALSKYGMEQHVIFVQRGRKITVKTGQEALKAGVGGSGGGANFKIEKDE